MIIKFKNDINKLEPKFIINDKFINIFYKSVNSVKNHLEYEEIFETSTMKKEISESPIDNSLHHRLNNNNLNLEI